MRCPTCNAHNADDAPWCTQCFERFTPEASEPPGDVAAPGEPDPREPPAADGGAHTATDGAAAERDIRVDGGEVEWRCATCGAWSPLAAPVCHRCASPRTGFGPAATPSPGGADGQRRVGPGGALLASALLPGLGHLVQGAIGTGIGRALLWVLWAGGGLSLLRTGGVSAGAVVLLLSALGLWVVTLVDVRRATAGAPPIATGRVLAWSVVVVTLLLVGAVMGASMGGGAR